MEPWLGLTFVLVLVSLIVLAVTWRSLTSLFRTMQIERARESFRLQRERLEAKFLDVAAASGKPRGLTWKDCEFESGLELARDRETGFIVALVPVTISFEAIPGGDMEGVEAVGNLRNASAVFHFERGHWVTHGRALFNMNPDEALVHLAAQYERIAVGEAG